MKQFFEHAALLVAAVIIATLLGWPIADALHHFASVVSKVMSNT